MAKIAKRRGKWVVDWYDLRARNALARWVLIGMRLSEDLARYSKQVSESPEVHAKRVRRQMA